MMAWFKKLWCPLLRTNCHFVSNLSQPIGIRNVSGQISNTLKHFFMFRFLGFSNSRYISEILIQNILPNLTMVSCKETWLIGVCAMCCLLSKPKVSMTPLCLTAAPKCRTSQSKGRNSKWECSILDVVVGKNRVNKLVSLTPQYL